MSRVIKAQSRRESCPLSVAPLHLSDLAAEAKRTILFARRRDASILAEAREEVELVRLDAGESEPVDVLVNGTQAARGTAVVVNGKLGVYVKEVAPSSR